MKLSSRLAKLKLNKGEPRPALKPAAGKGRKSTLKKWTVIVLCLLLAGGGTWTGLAIFVWEKLPPALIGKWEVLEGPMQGGTFDFSRNGTVDIDTHKPGTENLTIHGRVVVQGKTLLTTTRAPSGGREETSQSIIRELTPNSLILQLEHGDLLKMVRKQ